MRKHILDRLDYGIIEPFTTSVSTLNIGKKSKEEREVKRQVIRQVKEVVLNEMRVKTNQAAKQV